MKPLIMSGCAMKRRRVALLLIALTALWALGEANPRAARAQTPSPTPAPYIVDGPFVESQPSHDADGDGVNDTYGPTDVIRVEYHLSEIVCGDDSALTFAFQTGDAPPEFRQSEYGGCGGPYPARIYFEHTVTAGDVDGDGFGIAANSLYLKPYEGDGVPVANAAFSAGPTRKVNGNLPDSTPPRLWSAPRIANLPSDGEVFRRGEYIVVEASFSEDVVVDDSGGNPTIGIEIGGKTVLADYREHVAVGNGVGIETGEKVVLADGRNPDPPSRSLFFIYEVRADDKDEDGVIWVPGESMTVPPGSSIEDLRGIHAADYKSAVSSGSEFKIDGGLPPTVAPSTPAPPTPAPPTVAPPTVAPPTPAPPTVAPPTVAPPTPAPPTAAPPTAGLVINCAVGQPCVDIHADRTEISEGEEVRFTLSMLNTITLPPMTVGMNMQMPSGWSLVGEGLADNCSSQCSGTYLIDPGQQRSVIFTGRANQPGQYTLQGHLTWYFGNDASQPRGAPKAIQITVRESSGFPVPPVWILIGGGVALLLALAIIYNGRRNAGSGESV